ncbi:hypothetical protein [Nocardiopsis ansamitocini]|uniref:Uncharacterized protein n=1 Tax=Nocardiopsis ansamitocini TaxID=1670832 RepID=A0A9W6P3K2_9ACTN|nr:hypothetical protein [Nocardiopsis ansamitocini]GLU46526.1 hypothetical protein Nans01_08770 [Nocardiopsis ansamitocini]
MAKKRKKSALWRYWGYLPFTGALLGWLNPEIGPAVVMGLAAVSTVYFLFQAPTPCGAPNRKAGQSCRNNASGLLLGCYLQDHKWRRAGMLAHRHRWAELAASFGGGWRTALPVLAETATVVSGISAAIVYFVPQAK